MPCNVHKGGNGAIFLRAIEKKYGREMADRLFKDKNVTVKADTLFYDDKIYEFERYMDMTKRELIAITKGL